MKETNPNCFRLSFLISFAAMMVILQGFSLVRAQDQPLAVLKHGPLKVQFNPATNSFIVSRAGRVILQDARLSGVQETGTVRIIKIKDAFATGTAIEMEYPSGRIERIIGYDGIPFICLQTNLYNQTAKEQTFDTVSSLSAFLSSDFSPDHHTSFGCEAIQPLTQKRQSYSFLSIVNPQNRCGIVAGYLTHRSGSGIMAVETQANRLSLEGRTEYGVLRLRPEEKRSGELLAIGYFEDCLDGLEAYADACAKVNSIQLPPVPSGYCTWYHARASDEKRTAELADYCAEHLKDYGFDFIQIDDFWQVSTQTERRDFTTHKPDGPYPSGMKQTALNIAKNGLIPGLWLIPFAWDYNAPALRDHPDWFMKNADGEINKVRWAGYCLDNTHPDTRKFLAEVISRITHDWGYKYLKLDGLWSGIGARILYPSPKYRPDELGKVQLHDPYKTPIEAYRMGLQNVRQAAGDDVFILGCNIAQNMRTMGASFGLVDGMRVGRDVGAKWDKIVPCAALASSLYFFHGRVWYNDPDCLMLREPLTLGQARAWGSLIGLSGQMNVVSEWLPGLPAERLEVVKRTLPNHGLCARPVDLFESDIAQVWYLPMGTGNLKRHIVGLFNWDEHKETTIQLNPDKIGLPQGEIIGFDFWANQFIEPFSGTRTFTLKPSSCKVLSLQPVQDHPQVISTSRHITQGGIDLLSLHWDRGKKVLSGKSKVISQDPYELRIVLPQPTNNVQVSAKSKMETVPCTIRFTNTKQVRIQLKPAQTGTLSWRIRL